MWLSKSFLLPDISFSKDMSNRGLKFVLSPSVLVLDLRVTDTLVCKRTFSMAPSRQKSPTGKPSSSAMLIMTLSLHFCSGRSCLRAEGELTAMVPCWVGRRVQAMLLKGAGRQVGSWGANRSTLVFRQSLISLHSGGNEEEYYRV